MEKQDSAQQDPEYYPSSPIYISSYDSEVAPALMDSLVPAPELEEDTEHEIKKMGQENKDAE